jgi:hypothetical protein
VFEALPGAAAGLDAYAAGKSAGTVVMTVVEDASGYADFRAALNSSRPLDERLKAGVVGVLKAGALAFGARRLFGGAGKAVASEAAITERGLVSMASDGARGRGAELSGRLRLSAPGDRAVRNASRAIPEDGYFDFVAHGEPGVAFDEFGQTLDAHQVASRIRGTPSWQGQNVRLLVCEGGAGSCSLAQGVANELAVSVQGATTKFRAHDSGKLTLDAGGEWLVFRPQ